MTSSDPNKLFPGQTGFPTPNAAPDMSGCRVFSIPSDEEWFALLMAAVSRLTYEWAWYKNGTMTQAEAAAAWSLIIDNAVETSLLGQCGDTVPAPYWDTYADEDDEAGVLDQPWYGELVATPMMSLLPSDELTWQENLAIWIIAGFGVYAGQIGAAIAFVPFARQFVLKFRANPIGATAGIFLDGEVIALRDTYSATEKIVEQEVVLPDDGEDHTLWVAVNDESNPLAGDNPVLQVVRKELSSNEVYPDDIIYDSDCDCVKRIWTEGGDPVDYPQGDPRHSSVFLRPALTGSNVACDSAANMVKWIHDFIDSAISTMEAFGFLSSVVTLIFDDLSLISEGFTLFLAGVTELAGNLLTAGSLLIDTAFSSDQYDLLQCIFYCNVDSEGLVSPDALTSIKGQITAQCNTTVALIVNEILTIQGEIGLSNAGRIGSETGDCTSCDCVWCESIHFDAGDGGFTVVAGEGGSYLAGNYWEGTNLNSGNNTDLGIEITFTPTHFTYLRASVYKSAGSGPNNSLGFRGWSAGVLVYNGLAAGGVTGDLIHVFSSPTLLDKLQLFVNAGDSGGDTRCFGMHLEGTDANPFSPIAFDCDD